MIDLEATIAVVRPWVHPLMILELLVAPSGVMIQTRDAFVAWAEIK